MNFDGEHLAPAPDAVDVDEWEDRQGLRFRFFCGTRRDDQVSIKIVGFQHSDGSVDKPLLHLNADHVDLDSDGTRHLIADLTAALRELEHLSRR